ncbi:MAG: type II secretion system F family protein [Candidatus Nealsonbacteria bacterium]|nr:type II secretion system F family protein [Candidatus Nealsonbacteria bacterium]
MKFEYQARTKSGEMRTGIVEAVSREGAVLLLQGYGFFLTQLEEIESAPFYTKKIKLFSKASKKDLVMFSRQLSIMFRSEVPLVESLRTLSGQTQKEDFKEKIIKLSERIEGGIAFSQSLSSYPDLFDQFYINIVRSGESAGKLSDSLSYLADHLERDYYLRSKIRGAMIYPILIICMVIGVIFLMTYFVLPQLIELLKSTNQELPLITRVIIGATDFARSWKGVVSMIGFAVFLFLLFSFSKTEKGKARKDKMVLKLPMLGNFFKMVYVSRFAENLSTLISGGLPIAKSLEIAGNVVGNTCYEEAILKTTDEVKKGEKISTVLSRYPELFPAMFTTMIMVGEKTGTLDTSLLNVVNFYRQEIERGIEDLLKILEPVLILFLGLGVGLVVGAILVPLYQAVSSA